MDEGGEAILHGSQPRLFVGVADASQLRARLALLDIAAKRGAEGGDTVARLIEKENVCLYKGDTVYLETKFGAGLVQILAFSYRQEASGEETVNSVEWAGFDEHEEYDMEDYGVTWRLWDVYVETPSVREMEEKAWRS